MLLTVRTSGLNWPSRWVYGHVTQTALGRRRVSTCGEVRQTCEKKRYLVVVSIPSCYPHQNSLANSLVTPRRRVSTRWSMGLENGPDVLWCPAEIVVCIIGRCKKRFGGRNGCNILYRKPLGRGDELGMNVHHGPCAASQSAHCTMDPWATRVVLPQFLPRI